MTNPAIVCGDCRIVLPLWAYAQNGPDINVVLTAPPFIGGGHPIDVAEWARREAEPSYLGAEVEIAWRSTVARFVLSWLPLCRDLVGPGGEAWIVAPPYHLQALLSVVGLMRWPVRETWTKPGEALVLLTTRLLRPDAIAAVAAAFLAEPAQRDVPGLTDRFVRAILEQAVPGGVLDPFCGRGGVPRAAAQLGRLGVGIECDETICREALALCEVA